jgi:hypothetical protein
MDRSCREADKEAANGSVLRFTLAATHTSDWQPSAGAQWPPLPRTPFPGSKVAATKVPLRLTCPGCQWESQIGRMWPPKFRSSFRVPRLAFRQNCPALVGVKRAAGSFQTSWCPRPKQRALANRFGPPYPEIVGGCPRQVCGVGRQACFARKGTMFGPMRGWWRIYDAAPRAPWSCET